MSGNEILRRYPPHRDNLLLIMHDLQRENSDTNCLTDTDVTAVAEYLDIPLAEVDGTLSFYTLFSRRPRGRYVIRLCDSLSCRICGSQDVYAWLAEKLKIGNGETTGDGMFSLEIVNCLGNCDKAPNMMINEVFYSNFEAGDLERILAQLGAEAKP